MAAGSATAQQGEGCIVPSRIELGIGHPDPTGEVAEGRMIGIVHDRIVDDLPKQPEIRSWRLRESDRVNSHVEECHDQQRLTGRILSGDKGVELEDVMSVNGKLNPDTHQSSRGQRRNLRRRPYEAEIGHSSFREQLKPVSIFRRTGDSRQTTGE